MPEFLHTAEAQQEDVIGGLVPVLRSLDRLLERAIASCRLRVQSNGPADPFRGLYVTEQDTERLLRTEPGGPAFFTERVHLDRPPEGSSLRRLAEEFSLSAFDLGIVAVALAPEIDLRYERLYAFLHDDVTRKRPSVDLVLNLLCSSAEERAARRRHFALNAPLLRHGILHLFADPSGLYPPLIAHCVKLEERIIRFLLCEPGLDPRLASFCNLMAGSEFPLSALPPGLLQLCQVSADGPKRLICLSAGSRTYMRQAAAAAANSAGFLLLATDLSGSGGAGFDVRQRVQLALLEAKLQNAIPCFEGFEDVDRERLFSAITDAGGPVFLCTTRQFDGFTREGWTVISLELPPLRANARREIWETSLARNSACTDSKTLDLLAGRFRLTPEKIGRAVSDACARAIRSFPKETSANGHQRACPLDGLDLIAAARAQSSASLPGTVCKIQPKYTWNDLVLPSAVVGQLHEFCSRVARTEQVMAQWGFENKLSQGKGTTALFTGLSGTGKTMAAEVIAHELQLGLCKIEVAAVISKYIGETEQNLDRIFTAAEGANSILFFDEADALFGKRSEVRDSHDRYANLEISYLLQRMEAYEGVAILASNLSQNMDEAFLRRFAFTIRFPFPDQDARRAIWKTIWPAATPLAADIDFDSLARQFTLSGGNIKNAAVAAAFLAAEEGVAVNMLHLLQAVQREYQKMGKFISLQDMTTESRLGALP